MKCPRCGKEVQFVTDVEWVCPNCGEDGMRYYTLFINNERYAENLSKEEVLEKIDHLISDLKEGELKMIEIYRKKDGCEK